MYNLKGSWHVTVFWSDFLQKQHIVNKETAQFTIWVESLLDGKIDLSTLTVIGRGQRVSWMINNPYFKISWAISSDVLVRILFQDYYRLWFFWGRPKKQLEGFVWRFLSITGLRSQRQFSPKCSFLESRPLGYCSFRVSWQMP